MHCNILFYEILPSSFSFAIAGLENDSTDSSDFIEYKSMRPMRERRRAKSVPNIWKSESDDCDKEDDFNFNQEQLKHNRFNVNSYNAIKNSSKRSINNRNHDMLNVPMMNLPPSKATQTMLKQQITDINKNQQNFENIYNNHADWLISLRKELNGHTNL